MNNISPPRPDENSTESQRFDKFMELVRILRVECPWDRKQTNESIAHLTIEESYEILDAIEENDDKELTKELGDVLLHILLHSVIAEQRGAFSISDIINEVHEKMIHRHPHVFGSVEVKNDDDVVKNWETLKKKEGKLSALDGVPKGLPALLKAERIQHKASKVGFDWDDKNGVWDKVFEEIDELKEVIANGSDKRKEEEFGDVLFSLVNAARHEGIVPEKALNSTNNKFIRRFQYIEASAKKAGKNMDEMSLEEMDLLWEESKINT